MSKNSIEVFNDDKLEIDLPTLINEMYVNGFPQITEDGAGGATLSEALKKAAKSKGLQFVSEFGADKEAATKTIDELLKQSNAESNSGLRTLLIEAWAKAKAGPEEIESASGGHKSASDLLPEPKGTDLEGVEISFDDPGFEIKDRVDLTFDDKLPDITTFASEDWISLAKRTWMCHGLNLDLAYGTNDPESTTAAQPSAYTFNFRVPEKSELRGDPIRILNNGTTESRSYYSAEERGAVQNLIQSGGGSISGDYMGNGGSVAGDYTYYCREATKTAKRNVYVSVCRRQYYAELDLAEFLRPSAHFKSAIEAALAASSDEQRYEALQGVFKIYGHVAPEKVTLGGLLYYHFSKTVTAKVTDEKIEEIGRLAAEAHMDYEGFSGQMEGHGSHEDANGNTFSAQSVMQEMTWTNVGGGPRTVEDSKAWLNSLSDPNLWAVVRRDGLRMVTDWLDDDLKAKVDKVLDWARNKVWDGRKLPTDVAFPPLSYSKTAFPPGKYGGKTLKVGDKVPFFIANATDASATVVRARRSILLDQTADNVEAFDRNHAFLGYIENNVINDDERNRHFLWQLVYTGHTTGASGQNGLPIFWIVSYPGDYDADVEEDHYSRDAMALCAVSRGSRGDGLRLTRFGRLVEAASGTIVRLPKPSHRDFNSLWTLVPEPPATATHPEHLFRIVSLAGSQIDGSPINAGPRTGSLSFLMRASPKGLGKMSHNLFLIPRPDLAQTS